MAAKKRSTSAGGEPAPMIVRGGLWIRLVGPATASDNRDRPLPSPRHLFRKSGKPAKQ